MVKDDSDERAKQTEAAPKREANEHGDPNIPGAGGAPRSGGPSAGGKGKELETPASGNVPTDERLDAQRDASGNVDEGHQIPEYQRLSDREKELVKGGMTFAAAQEQATREQTERVMAESRERERVDKAKQSDKAAADKTSEKSKSKE